MTTTMDETWPKQALALYYVDMKDDVDDDDGVLFYTYENKKIKRRKGRIELVVCHHCSTRQRQSIPLLCPFQMCQAEACLDVSSPSCLFIQGSDTWEGGFF